MTTPKLFKITLIHVITYIQLLFFLLAFFSKLLHTCMHPSTLRQAVHTQASVAKQYNLVLVTRH